MFKKRILCALLLLLLLAAACTDKKDPVKPEPNPEPPPVPAYTFIYGDTLNATAQCPQVDIPWPSLANSPWPMAMVNQQGLSRTPFPVLTGGSLIWSEPPVPADTGYGHCDRGLAVGPDGTIYRNDGWSAHTAISTAGQKLWTISDPYEPRSGAAIGNDSTIYCGARHGFLAISPKGTVKWAFREDLSFSEIRPLIGMDGTIYARSNSTLYAVTPDGSELWHAEVSSNYLYCITASPDGEALYVNGATENLVALNANTGNEIWRFHLGFDRYYHVAVDNAGNLYTCRTVQDTLREIISISPGGEERWSYRASNSYDALTQWMSCPSIACNGYIYTDMHEGGLIALDYEGQFRWSFKPIDIGNFWPAIIDPNGDILLLSDGHDWVYKISEDGHLITSFTLHERFSLNGLPSINPSAITHNGDILIAAFNRILQID